MAERSLKEMHGELEDLRVKIAECEEICDKAKDRDDLSETKVKVANHYARVARHFKIRAADLEKKIAKLSSEE